MATLTTQNSPCMAALNQLFLDSHSVRKEAVFLENSEKLNPLS